jgi:hypothetical protein
MKRFFPLLGLLATLTFLAGADFNSVKIPSVTVTVSDFTLDYSPASKEVALKPDAGGAIQHGTSDADGLVAFERVTPGLYTLTISGVGLSPFTLLVPNQTGTFAAKDLVISAWTPPSGASYPAATANLRAWSLLSTDPLALPGALELSGETNRLTISGGALFLDGSPIGELGGSTVNVTVSNITANGSFSLSGQANLYTDDGTGLLRDGVAVGGYWTGDTDANGHSLTNALGVQSVSLSDSATSYLVSGHGSFAAGSFDGSTNSYASGNFGSFGGAAFDASTNCFAAADSGSVAGAYFENSDGNQLTAGSGSFAGAYFEDAVSAVVEAYGGSIASGYVGGTSERISAANPGSLAIGRDVVSSAQYGWTFGRHFTNAVEGFAVGFDGATKVLVTTNGVSVPSSVASTDTTAAVSIAATGWTNTFGKNATVFADGTNITFKVFNNAGTAVYTNTAAHTGALSIPLQSGGAVIISGTGVHGQATAF